MAEYTVPRPVAPAGPELEPVPVAACDVCQALAQEREKARTHGRHLAVRSCNAVIAGHPHGRASGT
ncbi:MULTISPECIES: hypothetical protein [Streptomyces]|uniref:Uncharacterized protein n=1 Tax=Streptomyces siderophoricus TaxID=2802281 RepID=A0ABS1N2M9_9ACTN|nr:hypothetical protein [Streptomyces sp. 9-7]MBL1094321.1 hypothetical protein [Streptomyces sp. 9-7]